LFFPRLKDDRRIVCKGYGCGVWRVLFQDPHKGVRADGINKRGQGTTLADSSCGGEALKEGVVDFDRHGVVPVEVGHSVVDKVGCTECRQRFLCEPSVDGWKGSRKIKEDEGGVAFCACVKVGVAVNVDDVIEYAATWEKSSLTLARVFGGNRFPFKPGCRGDESVICVGNGWWPGLTGVVK